MGFLATRLGSIPATGFNWYVFILTDNWSEGIRDEIERNFQQMARVTGDKVLVVKGLNPEEFYNELFREVLFHYCYEKRSQALPGLLVTNKPLPEVKEYFEILKWKRDNDPTERVEDETTDIRVALFPLQKEYLKRGNVVEFMSQLANALHHNTLPDLSRPSEWEWLRHFFTIKPNFHGFGVDFNVLIERFFVSR